MHGLQSETMTRHHMHVRATHGRRIPILNIQLAVTSTYTRSNMYVQLTIDTVAYTHGKGCL